MRREQYRTPDMSKTELVAHLLNRIYFLFKEEQPIQFLVEHALDETRIILGLPEQITAEEIIKAAINLLPERVKKNDFYINRLNGIAVEANFFWNKEEA